MSLSRSLSLDTSNSALDVCDAPRIATELITHRQAAHQHHCEDQKRQS